MHETDRLKLQIEMKPRPELGDTVVLARGGVTVLIRDVTVSLPGGMMDLGTISLSADRVVVLVARSGVAIQPFERECTI